MKKLSTVRGRESKIFNEHNLTIGLDLGDRSSYYCVLDEAGKVIQEANVGTNKKAMAMVFGSMGRCRIGMEVGTKDGLLRTNKQLEEMLTGFGVTHTYEEYEGDHTNRVFERIEKNTLPFFSKNLSFEKKGL